MVVPLRFKLFIVADVAVKLFVFILDAVVVSPIKSYSVDQNFTNINLTGKITSSSIGDGSTQYGYNSSAGNQCIAIGISANSANGQINSTCVGHNSKTVNGYGVAIGCYSCSNAINCVAIGYNAGNQSNSNNSGCIYIGCNSNINYTTTHTNSVCIGIGSMISNSNTIQLGRDLLDTTNCYALTTTNLTATNITATNINLSGIIKYTTANNTLSLGYNSIASINNSCAYGSSSTANMNNCTAIGDSAVTASYFCTSIGQNSYSAGQGTLAIGCNAGKNSNSQNSNMNFCSYIGSNTGCDVSNSTYTYATCIGAGSVISSSASIQLGRPGDTTTASNINTTNLAATTATINTCFAITHY